MDTIMLMAKDIMTRGVATASPHWNLGELAAFFNEEEFHGAPVTDSEGLLIGIVTDTDIVEALGEGEATADAPGECTYGVLDSSGRWEPLLAHLSRQEIPVNLTVRDVMTVEPLTAGPDVTAGKLAAMMLAEQVHRIVITENQVIRGIVTATDLLRALVEYESPSQRQLVWRLRDLTSLFHSASDTATTGSRPGCPPPGACRRNRS